MIGRVEDNDGIARDVSLRLKLVFVLQITEGGKMTYSDLLVFPASSCHSLVSGLRPSG